MRRSILAFAALVVAGPALAADAPALRRDKVVTSTELQSDVAVLRQAYEQLHPGLYRYNTKAEMDAAFDDLRQRFGRDRSLADAFLELSTFAARIRCGHTYPNFFNQKKAVAEALFQGRDRLPFYFRWLGGRMVVVRDFTPGKTLPPGTEVLSLDGTPVRQILDRLLTVARADGHSDAKRVSSMEVVGDSRYEAFDIYFPLLFPKTGGPFQLVVRSPRSATATPLAVEPLSYADRLAAIQTAEEARKGGDGPSFEWKTLDGGVALLKMANWALYDTKWDWKAWLAERLDALSASGAPALVIDLRGNEGGLDVGNEILPRLVREDVKVATYRRLVRYRETPPELDAALDTWDPSFKKWGAAATELAEPWPTAPPVHYFALNRYDDEPGGDVIRPAGKPFRGRVYVLVDASNSSATFQFAQLVQEKKLGTLVGEPTGGNRRGINGGAFFFLRLPKSGLEMDVPLIGTFPATAMPDGGLTPDVAVTTTAEDIAQGRDPFLAAVAR